MAERAFPLQETRLQATIAQQSKLIDFLQNASSPPSKSRLRIGKVYTSSHIHVDAKLQTDSFI